jgi:hypothetical protein
VERRNVEDDDTGVLDVMVADNAIERFVAHFVSVGRAVGHFPIRRSGDDLADFLRQIFRRVGLGVTVAVADVLAAYFRQDGQIELDVIVGVPDQILHARLRGLEDLKF